jgi:hypothetical protein
MAWHQLLGRMCCHHFLPPHTKRHTALHNSPTVSSVLPLQTPTPQTSFFFYTLVTLHLGQVKYCRRTYSKLQQSPAPLSVSVSVYLYMPPLPFVLHHSYFPPPLHVQLLVFGGCVWTCVMIFWLSLFGEGFVVCTTWVIWSYLLFSVLNCRCWVFCVVSK